MDRSHEFCCPYPGCRETKAWLVPLRIRQGAYTPQEFAPTYRCAAGHWSRARLDRSRKLVSPVIQTFTAPLGLDDVEVSDLTEEVERQRAAITMSTAIEVSSQVDPRSGEAAIKLAGEAAEAYASGDDVRATAAAAESVREAREACAGDPATRAAIDDAVARVVDAFRSASSPDRG